MTIEIRILGAGDEAVLHNVAAEVFDNPVDPRQTAAFLQDGHHHLAVALDGDLVVGFASGVTYLHPDKPMELWINEVGVAASHRRQGIGKKVVQALCQLGRAAGCQEAWVLTDRANAAAMRLYETAGGAAPDEVLLYSFALEK